MDVIRLATEEEVKTIADTSDLTPATKVLTFGGKDFAVCRNCYEVDPFYFAEDSTNQRKRLFIMNIETALRLQGLPEYYFNVAESNPEMRHVVETMGAFATSREPEIRYKRIL